MWKRQAAHHGRMFAKHVIPSVIKPARTLWNEVIGFFFMCLGVIFGFQAVRSAIQHETGKTFVAGACTLLMLWYGVTSFLRARKISRS